MRQRQESVTVKGPEELRGGVAIAFAVVKSFL